MPEINFVFDFISMSLMAIPLIAVIALIRFFTVYKLPKKTFYGLWGLVLYKLFIPFDLFVNLNISNYIDSFINKISGLKEMFAKVPKIPEATEVLINSVNISDITTVTDTINTTTEITMPSMIDNIYNIYDSADKFGRNMFDKINTLSAGINTNINAVTETAESVANTPNLYISPLLLVWIAGFMICVIYFTVTYIKFRKKFAAALPVDNNFMRSWSVGQSDSIRRKIKIRQSDLISSPLTYGIFKPVILLPKTTDYNDEIKLEYILLHEYTHIKRFDTLAKLFYAFALCVHWFNPFVWLMYMLANRDIELSCDETVVKKIAADKAVNIKSDYALTLIALEEKKSRISWGVNFSRNIMKERIKSIMKLKKTSKAKFLLAVILISIILVPLATLQSCEDKTKDENQPDGGYNEKPEIVVPESAKNFPTDKWAYDSPQNHNINQTVLWTLEDRMSEHVVSGKSYGSSVTIMRDGYIVYENNEGIYNFDFPVAIWSVTKSFTSALIGIAIDEGYIGSVDDKVLDYFKDWNIENIDDMKKSMTIKDVLTMRSGLKWEYEDSVGEKLRKESENPVLDILNAEMVSRPGTDWQYNTAASSILTAIIQKTTGMTAFEYAQEKLFDPLGITEVTWETDKSGINYGGFGLSMLTHDLLKFGYLFLQNGVWDGKQIIPAEWVKESTTCGVDTGVDLYGYHWRALKGIDAGEYLLDSIGYSITLKEAVADGEIYRAEWYSGYYIYVWPRYNIVVAIGNFAEDIGEISEGKYGRDYGNNVMLIDILASIVEATEYTENPSAAQERLIVPEMTGELLIYKHPYNEDIIDAALKIYKKQYTNVDVKIVEYDDFNQYNEILRAEVTAGKGPDLWIGNFSEFPDIYKTANAGVFEDLTEYMKNDGTDWSIYNKAVLDGGIYKGKQYFMPISYQTPVLLTTEEIMREEQIDFGNIKTFDNLIKVIRQFQQKYSPEEKRLFRHAPEPKESDSYVTNFFPFNGMNLIDYEAENIIEDSETLRDMTDAIKWAYVKNEVSYQITSSDGVELLKKEKLFGLFNSGNIIQNIANEYGILLYHNQPLYMPYPDIHGNITASADLLGGVFKNSKNKINAYNFLKIILSEPIQTNDMVWQITIPVLKSAVIARFGKILQEQERNGQYYPIEIWGEKTREIYERVLPEQFEMMKKEYGDMDVYREYIPEETLMEMADMLINIDNCVISPKVPYEFFRNAFESYFDDSKTYEQCFSAFKNKLKIYVSE